MARVRGGLFAGPEEMGGQGRAAEEERWGQLVVPAPPMWYPRCTGAHPTNGPTRGNEQADHSGRQSDRQVEVSFLACRRLPGSKSPKLRNERLIGLNASFHVTNSSKAEVQTQLMSDLDNQPYY